MGVKMSWVFSEALTILIFDKGSDPKRKIGSTNKRTNHFRNASIFPPLPPIYSGIGIFLYTRPTNKIPKEKLAGLTKKIF